MKVLITGGTGSLGSSWLQIERCMKAQWRGYDAQIRNAIELAWEGHLVSPGNMGRSNPHRYVIWYVDRGRHIVYDRDMLMSVKEDFI